MTADTAGNDLDATRVVVTSKIRIAPYDATKQLTADLIAPSVADPATKLDTIFSKGGFVGLITSDGAPQDGRDADDATEFHQPGYLLNADAKLTVQFTAAEDNDITRQMTIGTPDENGVYHITDVIQNGKWFAYQETAFKSGVRRRRLGVVQLTGNEPDQETRGSVAGNALTIEWVEDEACDNGSCKYLQAFVKKSAAAAQSIAEQS